jgi:SAM-dependent methyltransferase
LREEVYLRELASHGHWWFVGRRSLFRRILYSRGLSARMHVLDVGVSSGTNLRMLAQEAPGAALGLDVSLIAARICYDQGLGPVVVGDAARMPLGADQFDVVMATDVIEHLDDDRAALAEIYRVLKPGGTAIITVPAFMSLWGLQDIVSSHRRRYRLPALLRSIRASGLEVETSYYFNFLMFGPIWLARQVIRLLRIDLESENQVNHPVLNRVMVKVFLCDLWLAERVRPSFGVSALAVCRKPGSA